MGKRQVRVFQRDIGAHQSRLLQQQAHVVLRQGTVYRGQITALTAATLTLENQRLKPHVIPVEDIEEIIYDLERPY